MERRRSHATHLALFSALVLTLTTSGCVRAGFDSAPTDGAPVSEGPRLDLEGPDTRGPDAAGKLPAGTRDPSFGDKGLVILTVNPTDIDQAKELAVDASGRIVVGGHMHLTGKENDIFVARYLASGALDTSFNGKGFVVAGSKNNDKNDTIDSMALDSKGRVVVGGQSYKVGLGNELSVARFSAAGTLDASFGDGGFEVMSYGSHDDRITKVIVDASDRILFSAWTEKASSGPKRFLVGRLTSAGAKDASFGTSGGIVATAFTVGTSSAWAGVALDSAGRVVAGGRVWTSAAEKNDVAVARFLADGSLDASFGSGGEVQVTAASGAEDFAWGVALDGSNRVVLVGESGDTLRRLFAIRLRSDGSLDPTFADKGVYLLAGSVPTRGHSVNIDGAGRIVVAGHTRATNQDVVVVRLDKDGKPDLSLGGKGYRMIDLGGIEAVRGSTLDAAGRLLITGWRGTGAAADSFILRLVM